MVLVERLNQAADNYALKLARSQCLVHNSGLDYGENLYMSWGKKQSKADHVLDACDSWYNEIKQYNFRCGGFSMATGHFTAMVWKGSTQLGIGFAEVNGCVCVVANYKPWPNVQGQFGSNVLQFREVEESDDEEEKERKRQEAEKAKEEEAQKAAEGEEPKDDAGDLPGNLREAFESRANDGTIGWSELMDILNEHVRIQSTKFDGFNKAICSLVISLMTLRDGEKPTIDIKVFGNVVRCMQTTVAAFVEFDKDRSGALDPFEIKSALEEAGFKISYKTFQILQKHLGEAADGSIRLGGYILCYLLLSKLQVVMETKSETGMFEDFSMKEWITEEIEAVSTE